MQRTFHRHTKQNSLSVQKSNKIVGNGEKTVF